MKITDDMRILVTLRDGGKVRNFYRAGFKFSRAPEYWCSVEDAADDKRFRLISMSSLDRCYEAGLIVASGTEDTYSRDLTYALTPAGTVAAAAVDVTLDRALERPQPRKPKPKPPEPTREEREAQRQAEARNYCGRQELHRIGRLNRLVPTPEGWQVYPINKVWQPGEWMYRCCDPKDFATIRPWLEEFDGIDGIRSLRGTAEAREIIAKRRPL